jgi:predicted Rdx family selenoprotein
VDSTLVPGLVGQFDVVVDGDTIFSKHKESRFPEPREILDALASR